MQRTLFLLLSLAAVAHPANLSDFTGDWENGNPHDQIAALRISRLTVRAWARCGNLKCDWGSVEAVVSTLPADKAKTGPSIVATFKRADSSVVLILQFENAETAALRVKVLTLFTGGSGRPDVSESDTLKRAQPTGQRSSPAKPARPGAARPTSPPQPPSLPSPSPPAQAKSTDRIPQFPWPPPAASAEDTIPRSFLLKTSGKNVVLRDVDQRLVAALDACGYVDKSYYAVPDGFALVTQLEQINRDGTPKGPPERWSAKVDPLSTFSLSDYIDALFTANPGRYRVIVFVITSRPFSQADAKVSKEETLSWLSKGLNQLPASIGNLPFIESYAATALVYEFDEPRAGEKAVLITPSNLTGRDHLTKAKIWPTLEK